ncbi:MAG: hypothetical protein HKN23_12925 [Verrucomicrobiales bacterium]|nr:hypothetical protein [Verrucomicrobiales bacterium]
MNDEEPKRELAERKWLRHETPPWVDRDSVFFLTICVQDRDSSSLVDPRRGERILEAARHYHDTRRWWMNLILLMPDHVHCLVQFPDSDGTGNASMKKTVANWKRYLAANESIVWQKGFFDHRIRNSKSLRDKAHYIRQNPVRAELVARPEDWPYSGGAWDGW